MKRAPVNLCVALLALTGALGVGCMQGITDNPDPDPSTGAGSPGEPEPPRESQWGGDGQQDDEDLALAAEDNKGICGIPPATISYFMSADDSNSMASPVLAREWLNAGLAPDPARIRTYEFLNYYNALYEEPPRLVSVPRRATRVIIAPHSLEFFSWPPR